MFQRNQKLLHALFKKIKNVFENTIYSFIEAVRDVIFGFILGLFPLLPDIIRTPLQFIGIEKIL